MGRRTNHPPAPKGLYRTPRRRTHGILETRAWTPFPTFLGGQSFLPVTQGAKSTDFQRPAFPPAGPEAKEGKKRI